jgi:hypothetical protein
MEGNLRDCTEGMGCWGCDLQVHWEEAGNSSFQESIENRWDGLWNVGGYRRDCRCRWSPSRLTRPRLSMSEHASSGMGEG